MYSLAENVMQITDKFHKTKITQWPITSHDQINNKNANNW